MTVKGTIAKVLELHAPYTPGGLHMDNMRNMVEYTTVHCKVCSRTPIRWWEDTYPCKTVRVINGEELDRPYVSPFPPKTRKNRSFA